MGGFWVGIVPFPLFGESFGSSPRLILDFILDSPLPIGMLITMPVYFHRKALL
jgi:hypothetical protein